MTQEPTATSLAFFMASYVHDKISGRLKNQAMIQTLNPIWLMLQPGLSRCPRRTTSSKTNSATSSHVTLTHTNS